jgi:hypothetical protein
MTSWEAPEYRRGRCVVMDVLIQRLLRDIVHLRLP